MDKFYRRLTYFLLIVLLFVLVFFVGRQIYENYMSRDPMLTQIKDELRTVFPDIDMVSLIEGDKSYTINKQKIYLCLKDAKGNYYNMNMLIYVTLHELAHVRCDEVGHTQKFHDIFQDMLNVAAQHGIYNPSIPVIQDYCEY